MTTALHEAGYTLTDLDPDYVVLGETRTYSFDRITTAIATNPDPVGPSIGGPLPATGAVAALIERATGIALYFVGKPNLQPQAGRPGGVLLHDRRVVLPPRHGGVR